MQEDGTFDNDNMVSKKKRGQHQQSVVKNQTTTSEEESSSDAVVFDMNQFVQAATKGKSISGPPVVVMPTPNGNSTNKTTKKNKK